MELKNRNDTIKYPYCKTGVLAHIPLAVCFLQKACLALVTCFLLAGQFSGCTLANPSPDEPSKEGVSGQPENSVPTEAGILNPDAPMESENSNPNMPTESENSNPGVPTKPEISASDVSDETGVSGVDKPTESIPSAPALEEDALEALLQQMTLREKVGQLFLVRPDVLDPAQTPGEADDSKAAGVTVLTEDIKETLLEYPVGGIIMFRKNLVSPEQITALNAALQNASKIPLFLSVDEEGGIVSRLANHPAFDLPKYVNAADVASGGNPADALEMGSTIGCYLQGYGFNMDFAPDADVNTNPDNPVIGTRAFSSDAAIAAQMSAAMAEGLRQQGVIAVFKHFPGHGDTAEDSHHGIAVSHKTKEEMEACEWLPFREASNEDCIMVGHIAVPEITGDLTPATMSYMVVTEILKEQLGFQGLVITDSLTMGAVMEGYSSGEAALRALQAGCDILLMPYDLREAFDAIVAAVEDGTFPEERLDEIVRHILQFKRDHGILLLE